MSETSNYMVEFCDPVQMTELCGHGLNVHNSVLIKFAGSTSNLTFFSCHQNKTLSDRNSVTIKYCLNLISRAPHLFFCLGTETQPATLIFQGDDRPADIYSASWQRKKNYKSVCLLPDFYYVNNNGYTWFLDKGIPDWSSRKLEFFWRGSTTGGFNITPESLDALPRYRLCKIAKARAPLTNVGFYNVVQAADHGSQQRIEERLRAEELFLPATEMRDYAERKYIIQVDGNGNSWELVRKLRLGCCLLLAESDWQLWHDRFIFPWEHFVPIKHDFSDLNDIIDWCLTHDDKAQKIAENGRAYALSIDFEQEMRQAAAQLAAHVADHPFTQQQHGCLTRLDIPASDDTGPANPKDTSSQISPSSAQLTSAKVFRTTQLTRDPIFRKNIAQLRPATQSSVSSWSTYDDREQEAQIANRESFDPHLWCHTDLEIRPWWQVELSDVYDVKRVVIYNRVDCKDRLTRFSLLRSFDGINWFEFYEKNDESTFDVFSCEIATQSLARFVRLRLEGRNFLHICWCEIFGEPADSEIVSTATAAVADALHRMPKYDL